jgi:hypothetical protein
LDQSLLFGIIKSGGSEGNIRFRARFFGIPLLSPELSFPRGLRVNDPQRLERRQDRFRRGRPGQAGQWIGAWCKRERPARGAFQGQIAVSGRRESPSEDLLLFVDGLDLRFEIVAQLGSCS